jgi:general secretion pathway protein L
MTGSSKLSAPNQASLFGLDLASFWRDLLVAWRGMLDWPVLSWLWPAQEVCLHLPTGARALSRELNAQPIFDAKRASSARLQAIVLPDELLLRRSLDLPKLQSVELQAALAFELQTLSPFAADELVWAYEIGSREGNVSRVHLVLASRRLIAQHISEVHPGQAALNPEVWVPRMQGPGFVVLPGFGEARRQRQNLVWRWVSAALVIFSLLFMVALALTPSIKQHLKLVKASAAMTNLQKKAAPAMAERESLVRISEQLSSLAVLLGQPVPPLKTLKLITDALPDDTYLLALQMQGLKVSISGQTGNAAALMKQLGSTAGLRDVRAPTPATRPLGAPRESFTIEFTLDPVQLSRPS